MYRKSILASALSLILLPNAAGALGLGGIRTQSALNEPFVGQIELLDVSPDELDTVKVVLASQAEFEKVGAERFHYLARLKFRPRVSRSGRIFVRVTTTQPVREPFLDFLVEVNWPKGRLVKEYTVLLDPPVTVDRRPPARLSRPPASVDTSAFPMRHGPVEQGSNLWRIARDMAPAAGATIDQTAMALYRSNQQAFIRGDINKLRVGETLEIPTAAELFALDARSAAREFNTAIKGGRVTTTPLTDITEEFEDRLEIAGAGEPTPSTRVQAEAPTRMPPAESTAKAGAPGVPDQAGAEQVSAGDAEPAVTEEAERELGSIQEDLLLVQEAGESTRQETEELRSRIRELEGQLADIQRLLELSNERFAALQEPQPQPLDEPGAEATDVPPSDLEAPRETTETLVEDVEAAPSPQPGFESTTKTANAEPAPDSEHSLWESIPKPPLPLILTLAIALLLMGWMALRRRRSLAETSLSGEFVTGAPAATAASRIGASSPEQAPSGAYEAATAQPFPPDSEMENLEVETEEADVIAEADIYIAYGRYREAEALLEEEAKNAPQRLDVKYKLAEAYYGAGNAQPLEALLEQIKGAGGDRIHPDQWKRLNDMMDDLKGTSAGGPRTAAASGGGDIPAAAGPEPAQEPDIVDRPVSEKAAQPPADLHDRYVPDSGLSIAGLEDVGDDLAPPGTEESLETSAGPVSELELQIEDLESLKDVNLERPSSQAPPVELPPVDELSALRADSQVDSLDISPVSLGVLDSDIESSQWQQDSGMWDEVATKIDLARAYLDMDDAEAARLILEEVAQEGNESQRAEAKELIAQLG